jgi:hypothetical protein
MFSSNKNNLQFGITLNNGAIVSESLILIFGITGMYFSKKLAIPNKIKLVLNQPRYTMVQSSFSCLCVGMGE